MKLKVLISGPSGHGKTTLARTLPGKTLIVSAESGLLSLAGSDIDFIDIHTNDKGEKYKSAREKIQRLNEIYNFLLSGSNYQNIFIDSLTEISQQIVLALNDQFPDRKDSLVLWSENLKAMRKIIKDFRDLSKYHVVMTCLSKVEKDDNAKRYSGFDLAGKPADEVPQYFDEVFYLNVNKDGKRELFTQPREGFICKDRSAKLLPTEEADLGIIFKKIFFKEEKEKKE